MRTIEGLMRLKQAFDSEGVPRRNLSESLILGTWNIREFDSEKYGARSRECLFYIAEIINRFDLVAIQEVREDLAALNNLVNFLGGWWKYVCTDVTEGRQGNRERTAFLFDSRKLVFGGLAGEIVIPPIVKSGKKLEPAKQLARTPFILGMKAGWFKFTICTTHILYGEDKPVNPERLEEIKTLATFLADRTKDKYAWSKNMILLGDFNIYDTTDETLKAITDAGFTIPEKIQKLPSNVPQTKHYDQIAFIAPDIKDQLELCNAGVFNLFEHVYRDQDEAAYAGDMGDAYGKTKEGNSRDEKGKTRYYKDWRTYQMSDHLPMWIELKTDFSMEYLAGKLN